METAVFKVAGMSCGHCQAAVTKALQGVAGVSRAEVDLERGEARVTYDPGRVSIENLRAAVEEAGYEVVGA